MPDENENNIAISELDEALDLTDSAQFPYTQNNGGTLTTFKARLTQIAAKIIEGLSFAGINLPTSAGDKTVENSINFLLDSVGGDPNGNISDSYDPTAAYVKGDLCIYENALYICTAPTTGTFDPSKWTATTIDNVIGDLSQLTTTDKSSVVGAVNEVVGDTYTKSEVDTALNNKTDKNTVNNYALSSSNPIIIFQTGAYHTFLIVGFVQGIGVVTLLAKITNSTTSVIDFVTGSAFSNANLTFAYNPTTKAFVIQTPQSGASNLTIIRGGST